MIPPIDYGELEGGLVRMMQRYHAEGTLTGDANADAYLSEDPNAAFLGLLYDQRVRAEYAFTGPHRLRDKLGHLGIRKIAAHDPEAFRALFAEIPAVHRFTNKMAEQTQAVAQKLVDEYDGDAANIWAGDVDFPTIQKRVHAFPGFGKQKSAKMKYVLHYFGYRDFSD